MSWIIDHASQLYILLGITAAALVVVWRFNQRVKFLGFAAGVLALMGVAWLAAHFGTSDKKKLELAVDGMASAVKDGNMDELFKHVSKDFQYKGMTRDILYQKARAAVLIDKVSQIAVRHFDVDELSREKKFAKTRFNVTAWHGADNDVYIFVVQADFVLEGEDWKLKTLRFYKPLIDQDQEMDLPLP